LLSEIRRIRFDDWDDFKANFRKHLPDTTSGDSANHFLFRGQRSEKWQLTSSFDRLVRLPSTKDRQREFEKWLDRFFEEVCWQHSEKYRPNSEELISLAQHNGLPTRLLDWSMSPYIAAFFAFAETINRPLDTPDNPAIWVINKECFESVVPNTDVRFVAPIDMENSRQRNQAGLFTQLLTDDESLDAYAECRGREVFETMLCMTIPAGEQRFILDDLNWMGIDYRSIYPGLTGIVKHILARYQLSED